MTAKTTEYDQDFYADIEAGCLASAEVIVPRVLSAVRVESVLDVGCGTGAWAATFARHGVAVTHGIDGGWVPPDKLLIRREDFFTTDVGVENFLAGLDIRPRYDLAVCLEVAEHLPEERAADLIAGLVTSAPVVLFSAAVPGQGGVGHVNEQWLDHWADLFAGHDYRLFDVIRGVVWDDERVEAWYAQNTVVFAGPDADRSALKNLAGQTDRLPLRMVHPRVFENSLDAWAGS